MQTIEEFMQSFFEERASLHRLAIERGRSMVTKYYSARYRSASKAVHQEGVSDGTLLLSVVKGVEQRGDQATVNTLEPDFDELRERIYKLCMTENRWQIDGRGDKCYKCNGTGRGCEEEACSCCKGQKWRWSKASEI